ncbi:MAG: UTP--glucose-1-phosphate uridylyltransferase [Chloroflexi bacterium]|nr:UTP--glucose-1-phosphate uridylyltransferase [Chloroflexota bacterium]
MNFVDRTDAIEQQFAPFRQRMQAEDLPAAVIETFHYYFSKLVAGETGMIPESTIQPVPVLPDAEALPAHLAEIGAEALAQTVMIKLNGGLGTTMGLAGPKSLLVVKDDLSFLDIVARQALGANVHLLLMNSFNTSAASLQALRRYPQLGRTMPLDFVQNKVPKIVQATLAPVSWPQNPALEWNPPGHGDIYTALMTSGMLDQMLAAGMQYAFVSNADNLGAVIAPRILGYLVQNQLPFLIEVADRTAMDRKGGHLARLSDGRLILRESAQCPPAEAEAFQDIQRHRYFNTNNIWLHLPTLYRRLREGGGMLRLPMIVNRKTVDPRDPASTPVFQLESAMGAAIAVFTAAAAIRVPRTRFAPVKSTNDLLAVRSDAYTLTDEAHLIPNPARQQRTLIIDLDRRYYKHIDALEERFPAGPPSLLHCQRLVIRGDVRFGRGVTLRGNIQIDHTGSRPLFIADHAVLSS